MKRLIPLLLLLVAPATANAGAISHKITTSAQATSTGAYSHAKRIGSTVSYSSTGVTITTLPSLASCSTTAACSYGAGSSISQTTAGAATELTIGYTQGDPIVGAMGSGSTVSSGVVANLPAFGDTLTYSGGSGSPTAAITSVSGGTVTLGIGGPGTSVTGSMTSELSFNN